MSASTLSRADVARARFVRQQLHGEPGSAAGPDDVDILALGVQDTGPDGAPWALEVRGAPRDTDGALAYAWTLRGAPHAYRRTDLADIAVATAPWSEKDAAKRIFDAARPLRQAGVPVLDALRRIAAAMRDRVVEPTVKGEVSAALAEELDEPYLRWCNPCQATHLYEQPFRLTALQAGLELEPGTSPPVLRRVPGLDPPLLAHLAGDADQAHDVIRTHLRFHPASTVKDVAGFLDSPVAEVRAHWPADTVEVEVDDLPGPRYVLADDRDWLDTAPSPDRRAVRMLGPFDPVLQLRDRELLVADEARRKELWRTLGRPGAIVADGEVLGTWRPRTDRGALTVRLTPWGRWTAADRRAVDGGAERLAAHRGVPLRGVVEAD